MSPNIAILLFGLTFVAEGLLWLWHKLSPNSGPLFA